MSTILLLIIMAAGCYLRLAPLNVWLAHEDRFFFGLPQVPLMRTVDSYFYIDIAGQLQDDGYRMRDERRNAPVGHSGAATPPLLSVVLAGLSSVSGIGLEWLALILPAVLGSLLAIPTYALAYLLAIRARSSLIIEAQRRSSARLMGLVSAGFSLLAPFYAARSSLGWLDTDMLNVTFPLTLTVICLKLADSRGAREQLMWLSSLLITSLTFFWWWDQSTVPVLALTAVPLSVALVFIGLRAPKSLLLPLAFTVALITILGFWKGWQTVNPFHYADSLSNMAHYISSDSGDSPFRPAGTNVTEQKSAGLSLFIKESSGWTPAFILACTGLLGLIFLVRGYVLFLAAILIVTLMSAKGVRFIIFAAPLFGLGIGTLVFAGTHTIKNRAFQILTLSGILLTGGWGSFFYVKALDKRAPRRLPVLFEAMKEISTSTPENAVIWASWGHGHPLVYYGQRATVADGIYHSDQLQYIHYVPLAADNFRLSANWISFYVAHGPVGLQRCNELFGHGSKDWSSGMPVIQELFTLGVDRSRRILLEDYQFSPADTEKMLHFLFPGNSRPILLLLDYLLASEPWYTVGRWDLENRRAPKKLTHLRLKNVRETQENQFTASGRLGKIRIDPATGLVKSSRGSSELLRLALHDGKSRDITTYQRENGLVAEILLPVRIGILADSKVADTTLVRLFYGLTSDSRYISPVKIAAPYYSTWQVHGDKYTPPAQ